MKISGVNIPYKNGVYLSRMMKSTVQIRTLCRIFQGTFSLVLTCAYVFDLARGGIEKPTKNLPNLFSKESTGSKKPPNPAIAIADMG